MRLVLATKELQEQVEFTQCVVGLLIFLVFAYEIVNSVFRLNHIGSCCFRWWAYFY